MQIVKHNKTGFYLFLYCLSDKFNKSVFLGVYKSGCVMLKKIYLLLVLVNVVVISFAQQKTNQQPVASKNKDLIQFSGVVVGSDSLAPIPYASIIVRHSSRGTISDYFGYFSFVAKKNDTLEFSAIGYIQAMFIVPDTLTSTIYSLIQVLHSDTVLLKPVNIYPWPSKEHFKQAFLNLNMTDKDLSYATKNLERAALKEKMTGMAADAASNYRYTQSQLYYAGQQPTNNLLNPIAWAKFIKAWQNGDFNKK